MRPSTRTWAASPWPEQPELAVIGDAWYPIESAPEMVWLRVRFSRSSMFVGWICARRKGTIWYGGVENTELAVAPVEWQLCGPEGFNGTVP